MSPMRTLVSIMAGSVVAGANLLLAAETTWRHGDGTSGVISALFGVYALAIVAIDCRDLLARLDATMPATPAAPDLGRGERVGDDGKGRDEPESKCPTCDGTGRERVSDWQTGDWTRRCEACGGEGG
jgi:hypothetical protein